MASDLWGRVEYRAAKFDKHPNQQRAPRWDTRSGNSTKRLTDFAEPKQFDQQLKRVRTTNLPQAHPRPSLGVLAFILLNLLALSRGKACPGGFSGLDGLPDCLVEFAVAEETRLDLRRFWGTRNRDRGCTSTRQQHLRRCNRTGRSARPAGAVPAFRELPYPRRRRVYLKIGFTVSLRRPVARASAFGWGEVAPGLATRLGGLSGAGERDNLGRCRRAVGHRVVNVLCHAVGGGEEHRVDVVRVARGD